MSLPSASAETISSPAAVTEESATIASAYALTPKIVLSAEVMPSPLMSASLTAAAAPAAS